jgi:hypothetical protein
MNAPITFAICGFGDRGSTYASMRELFPDKMKVVAVADLNPDKVKKAQELYDIRDPRGLKDIPTEKLLDYWDATTPRRIFEMPGCRSMLIYEFQSRNPIGFHAWICKENHTDEELRQFMLGNQDSKCLGQPTNLLMAGDPPGGEHYEHHGCHHRRGSARSHRVRVAVRKVKKGK